MHVLEGIIGATAGGLLVALICALARVGKKKIDRRRAEVPFKAYFPPPRRERYWPED